MKYSQVQNVISLYCVNVKPYFPPHFSPLFGFANRAAAVGV